MTSHFDVSADSAFLENGERGVVVKIASSQVEANVWLSQVETGLLKTLASDTPERSIRIGISAGKPVFWSRDETGGVLHPHRG